MSEQQETGDPTTSGMYPEWCDWCQHELQTRPEYRVDGAIVTGYFCSLGCADQWADACSGDPQRINQPQVRADGGSESGTKQQHRDVVEVTPSEYNSAVLKGPLVNVNIVNADEDGLDFGITIHQDGTDVALAAGTVRELNTADETPHIHTYHALSNEQAREIADALHAAVDEAERIAEEAEDDPGDDSGGILRRLMP